MISFNSTTHTYSKEGIVYDSVTQVLKILSKGEGLLIWAVGRSIEYIESNSQCDDSTAIIANYKTVFKNAKLAHGASRESSASEGTKRHADVEVYIKDCIKTNGGVAKESDVVVNFSKWAIKNELTFISSEQKLYNDELKLAGTYDFVCMKGGELYVGDFKTSKAIYFEYAMQVGAYGHLHSPRITKGVIFQEKNNTFHTLWIEDTSKYVSSFLAALTLFRAQKEFTVKKERT